MLGRRRTKTIDLEALILAFTNEDLTKNELGRGRARNLKSNVPVESLGGIIRRGVIDEQHRAVSLVIILYDIKTKIGGTVQGLEFVFQCSVPDLKG
jgi:hypothetical protein